VPARCRLTSVALDDECAGVAPRSTGTERKQSESDPDALVARACSCDVQADAFDDEEDDAAAWFIWATRGAPLHAKSNDAIEAELSASLTSGLTAREHMLDLTRLARGKSLRELDSDLCSVLSVMLAEISAWVAQYDPEPGA